VYFIVCGISVFTLQLVNIIVTCASFHLDFNHVSFRTLLNVTVFS